MGINFGLPSVYLNRLISRNLCPYNQDNDKHRLRDVMLYVSDQYGNNF